LSGDPAADCYRISAKREPEGVASRYLHEEVEPGALLEASAPRGSFILGSGETPVVMSAGIGATPVMAMLHSLAAAASTRPIWSLHGARDGTDHVFAAEVESLLSRLPNGVRHVRYSRPRAGDRPGRDFDAAGRLSAAVLDELAVPQQADFYLCGPAGFLRDLTAGLKAWGVASGRIHSETFGGAGASTPGIVGAPVRPPHVPEGPVGAGPSVSFARSGIATRWDGRYRSLLELAEACDVPVRWACRTGVCHSCESGLIAGDVAYDPEPLDPPADGNLLICCSTPRGDSVIDL
jgi:ferredoxin-NADP reductase/ferredoxin